MMFLLIVTLTSMLLAAIMSVSAWRIAGDERRRSDARVAALSAEIHDAAPAPSAIVAHAVLARRASGTSHLRWDEELELRPGFGRTHGSAPTEPARPAAVTPNLFAARRAPSGSRPFAVLAGGALVFGAAAAMAILFGGRFSRAPRSVNALAVAAPATLPLELVALGHERAGDQLTVRGVVRNPPSGAGVDRLTAVVLLFTSDGGFVASGRAALDSPSLRPGGESTFVVTIPGAGDVGRYRVSFRTADRPVSHVDRRHEG